MEANEAACSFYGYSRECFKGMYISDLNTLSKEQVLEEIGAIIEYTEKFHKAKCNTFRHRLSNGEIKDVEVYSNPIEAFGNKLLYSQILDVSERKKIENQLKEREERLRAILELSPDVIIICQDFKIVFANSKAEKIFGISSKDLISKSIIDFLDDNYTTKSIINMDEVVLKRQITGIIPGKITDINGKVTDVEISVSPAFYKGEYILELVIRDISEDKGEIKKAVNMQRQRLDRIFPIKNKADLNSVWLPAKGVSGDFYKLHKVNEDLVLGIIGDVSGKGITAALHVSALNIMFNCAANVTSDPVEVLQYINAMAVKYIGDDYIAACCFRINFKDRSVYVSAAGINEFIYYKKGSSWRNILVKGPFLGMFENSHFGQSLIYFDEGDKLLFYTDGLNEIFEEEGFIDQLENVSSSEFCMQIEKKVNNFLGQIDDCTCIVLDIH